jgi:hypothetical protein
MKNLIYCIFFSQGGDDSPWELKMCKDGRQKGSLLYGHVYVFKWLPVLYYKKSYTVEKD